MSIFIIRSLFVCLSDGSPAWAICHVYLYIVTWLWVGTLFSTASETTLVVHFIAANLSNHTHTRFSYYHLSHIILLSAHNKLEQQMTRLPPLTVQHPNIQETSSSPCNQVPVEHPFWIRVVGGFELNFNPIRIEFICKTLSAYHFTRKSSTLITLACITEHGPGNWVTGTINLMKSYITTTLSVDCVPHENSHNLSFGEGRQDDRACKSSCGYQMHKLTKALKAERNTLSILLKYDTLSPLLLLLLLFKQPPTQELLSARPFPYLILTLPK